MTDTPTPPVSNKTHDLRSVTVALIEIEARLRPARSHRIEALKQDIDCNGLTHPLLVVRKGQKYRLIAGLQRPCTALGRSACHRFAGRHAPSRSALCRDHGEHQPRRAHKA